MLRNFEKSYTGGILLSNQSDYVRCVLWASDPEVLNKYFIRDGGFTLEKLLKTADSSKKKSSTNHEQTLLAALKSQVKKQDPVLYSEIIDDHTILLLITPSPVLRMVFNHFLEKSPEYEARYVPVPMDLNWKYHAERYTNRVNADGKDIHERYDCLAHYSFEGEPLKFSGDYLDVRRLYDLVMQY